MLRSCLLTSCSYLAMTGATHCQHQLCTLLLLLATLRCSSLLATNGTLSCLCSCVSSAVDDVFLLILALMFQVGSAGGVIGDIQGGGLEGARTGGADLL